MMIHKSPQQPLSLTADAESTRYADFILYMGHKRFRYTDIFGATTRENGERAGAI